ncbi:MAG: bifunctional 4-hydroxy-2-oxoglutarate aldolase/2-dehydro-3-deoxy-phosphogluconate aldolase [Pirellulaceae bacterium]
MNSQFPPDIMQRIVKAGVVAVIVIDDPRHAVPLAKALLDGGVDAIELTLRTPAAIEALKEIRAQVPQMLAGVGTILTPEQVDQVVDAGGAFGVAPGLNRRVVQQARHRGLPFAPGVLTPSEVEGAIELGCRELKFFPAEPSGGMSYLNSMAAPYAHLGLRFIPLGGVDVNNMASYLESPLIAAVGGSWIAPRALIQQENWSEITRRSSEAQEVVHRVRSQENQ